MATDGSRRTRESATAPYEVLLRLLAEDRVTAEEFEVVFLRLYLGDSTAWPEDIFNVLDALFADVDDFCPDPALRAEVGGMDGEELRRRGAEALERLSQLVAQPRESSGSG